jgi:uncharacterized DUF497 family protein
VEWTWDEAKARENLRKHRVSFEAAVFALRDPLRLTVRDLHEGEERWRTTGAVGVGLLLVVHTWPDEGLGRVISARRAERHERRRYEG